MAYDDWKHDGGGEEDRGAPVEIAEATPLKESKSGKAILFTIRDGFGRQWIPKLGIHDDSDVWKLGQPRGKLVVKYWLAEEKEWV